MLNKVINYLGVIVSGLLFLAIFIGLAYYGFEFKPFFAFWGLRMAYVLTILGVFLIIIIGPVFTFIANPTNLIRAGIGIASLGILYLIGYGIAGPQTNVELDKAEISGTISHLVGGGLIMMYILFAGAFLAGLYSMIVDMFR